MRLLLHAITTAEQPATVPNGLRGGPLVRVDEAGLAGWSTQFAEVNPRFGRTDLTENHDLISALHQQVGACLPVRFPTWSGDEDALRADLRRRQAALTTALHAVRETCELAVTLLWTTSAETTLATPAATSGAQYLRARQQLYAGSDKRRARAHQLAEEIERAAGAALVAVRHQVCPSASVALSSALLIHRDCASGLMAILARRQDGVRILVNGPWPPYTFADTATWET